MKKLVLLLTFFLASCAGMTKVGPGDVTIREQVSAKLDSAWNRLEMPNAAGPKTEIWTTDGLTLDTLVFYVGIKDGEPLAELQQRTTKQQPLFRAGMQPHEIVELVETTATEDGSSFKLDKLSPAAFGGGSGFRFDFSQVRKADEVEVKGIGYGTIRDGKLYLMLFRAPKIYYFNKNLGRVETVAKSVRLRG